MVMRWFRRNSKILMAILVCVLMVSFVALPSMARLSRTRVAKEGRIRGAGVTANELRGAAEQIRKCQPLWFQLFLVPSTRPIVAFIFEDNPVFLQPAFLPTDAQVWRYLVLLREAENAGIQVTQDDLNGIPASLREAVVGLVRVIKLCRFKAEAIHITEPELWAYYNYAHERFKLQFAELRPDTFLPLTEAEPEEVRQFYEEHKDVQPDPASGVVGYQAPERVKMEYVLAELEGFKKRVSVSAKEIADYYEEHKSEFSVPEEKGEEQKRGGAEDDAGKEVEGESGEEALAPKKADEVAGDIEKAQAKVEPLYKPLAEVEEEIRSRLLDAKARDAALVAMNNMLSDLDEVAERFVNEPPPLEQMARHYELRFESFKVPQGRRPLSREDVESLVPGGSEVARRVFDKDLLLNFVSLVDWTPEGPLAFMVLERIKPSAEPFEQVEGMVRHDLLSHKALRYAETVAKELMQRAMEFSFEDALREMNQRLERLLGKSRAEGSAERGEKREPGAEGENKGRPGDDSILRIGETGFFTRADFSIPAMGGLRAGVAREAFQMDVGQFSTVVEEGADAACYVVQKVEQQSADPAGFRSIARAEALASKRLRLTERWLQGLLKASPVPEGMRGK